KALTFQKMTLALQVHTASSDEVQLLELVVRDNVGSSGLPAVYTDSGGNLLIANSTFLNNSNPGGPVGPEQLGGFGGFTGVITILNTVFWGPPSSKPMIAIGSFGT